MPPASASSFTTGSPGFSYSPGNAPPPSHSIPDRLIGSRLPTPSPEPSLPTAVKVPEKSSASEPVPSGQHDHGTIRTKPSYSSIKSPPPPPDGPGSTAQWAEQRTRPRVRPLGSTNGSDHFLDFPSPAATVASSEDGPVSASSSAVPSQLGRLPEDGDGAGKTLRSTHSPRKVRASTLPISGSRPLKSVSSATNFAALRPPDHSDANDFSAPATQRSSPRKVHRVSTTSLSRPSADAPPPLVLPMPPLSMPSYLQLELSSTPVSTRYIYRPPPAGTDALFESTRVKIRRLLNFLLLPPHLESVLLFGVLACLDAWLYNFTILPLRFCIALAVLGRWLLANAWKEMLDLGAFAWAGIRKVARQKTAQWTRPEERKKEKEVDKEKPPSSSQLQQKQRHVSREGKLFEKTVAVAERSLPASSRPSRLSGERRPRRTRSTPSTLLPNHKGDILRGLLIVGTCMILMRFDASRMYHHIRVQSAIKLYVIFNVLEVGDRLLSAIGQDIIECLLSSDVLERDSYGRSRIWRPFWMFILAMIYNTTHAIALFYQAITLNVAVNSYSNALLTLLMSNQFVEIKSTVFKRFDKEGLFQMTCADVIERFQLWLMMTIITMRNLVELGPFFSSTIAPFYPASASNPDAAANLTTPPSSRATITPTSFTLLPQWAGQVITPVLVVLGSEMLVDWLKHAYITKFCNTRRDVYGRYLDVLAKDYYTNSFSRAGEIFSGGGRDITHRLGLPVIPLACLFIRSVAQTCRMVITTHVPVPVMPSPVNIAALGADGPTTTAALSHIDYVFRRALGRSSFGGGGGRAAAVSGLVPLTASPSFVSGKMAWLLHGPYQLYLRVNVWELFDDAIALTTVGLFVLAFWLLLLAAKLALGMVLLRFSKGRYQRLIQRQKMLEREKEREKDRAREKDRDRDRKEAEVAERVAERESRGRTSRTGQRALRPINTSAAAASLETGAGGADALPSSSSAVMPLSSSSVGTTVVGSVGSASLRASTATVTPLTSTSAMGAGVNSSNGPSAAGRGRSSGGGGRRVAGSSASSRSVIAESPSGAAPGVVNGSVPTSVPTPNSGSGSLSARSASFAASQTGVPISSSAPTPGSALALGGSIPTSVLGPNSNSTIPTPQTGNKLIDSIPVDAIVKRAGPFGTVEVSDSIRECIFEGDPAGLEKARERVGRDLVSGTVGLAKAVYGREEGPREAQRETQWAGPADSEAGASGAAVRDGRDRDRDIGERRTGAAGIPPGPGPGPSTGVGTSGGASTALPAGPAVDDEDDGWIGKAAAKEETDLVNKLEGVGRYTMVGKRIW